jgi:hypothetical protein
MTFPWGLTSQPSNTGELNSQGEHWHDPFCTAEGVI